MKTLFISYLNLTPGIENKFANLSHTVLLKILRQSFSSWSNFSEKHPDFGIGFIITTKEGVTSLIIKGPSIDKKKKIIDFTIFLPTKIANLNEYLNHVFEGIYKSVAIYEIELQDILSIKELSKKELGI